MGDQKSKPPRSEVTGLDSVDDSMIVSVDGAEAGLVRGGLRSTISSLFLFGCGESMMRLGWAFGFTRFENHHREPPSVFILPYEMIKAACILPGSWFRALVIR